jgi:hypothetical protein
MTLHAGRFRPSKHAGRFRPSKHAWVSKTHLCRHTAPGRIATRPWLGSRFSKATRGLPRALFNVGEVRPLVPSRIAPSPTICKTTYWGKLAIVQDTATIREAHLADLDGLVVIEDRSRPGGNWNRDNLEVCCTVGCPCSSSITTSCCLGWLPASSQNRLEQLAGSVRPVPVAGRW